MPKPTLSRLSLSLALVAALGLGSGNAHAREEAPSFTQLNSFIQGHPDMFWRRAGVRAYKQDRFAEALSAFRRAARYADKPSQAMIAQMLWNGDGVAVDRVMAYVWADLAAERGYPEFIVTRERFWHALDPVQQRAAVAAGQAIFDEYGDKVAKRRTAGAMLHARRNITGSRTGHVGTLMVSQQLSDGTFASIDGALFYADKYWKPELYWQWQDSPFERLPEEKVEVGPLQLPPKP